MNAYMGFSIYGVGIFINEKDLEPARRILEEVELQWDDTEDFDFGEEEEQDFAVGETFFERVGNKRTKVVRYMILLAVVLFLLGKIYV